MKRSLHNHNHKGQQLTKAETLVVGTNDGTAADASKGSGTAADSATVWPADDLSGCTAAELNLRVASGELLPTKAWHYFRRRQPTLPEWQVLGRLSGRTTGWAYHQHQCWSLLSEELDYAEQRDRWLEHDRQWLAEQLAAAASPRACRRRAAAEAARAQLSLLEGC